MRPQRAFHGYIATYVSLCYTVYKALLTTVGGLLPSRIYNRGVIGMNIYEFLTVLVLLLSGIIAIKA